MGASSGEGRGAVSEEPDASAEALADTIDSGSVDSQPPERVSGESLSGQTLDHFRVEGQLGQGGMGTVYEAWDESLARRVALKVLRSDVTHRPGQTDRFLREARAQARLNHPNVVQIYYIGHRDESERGNLYFAMELIGGESLGALVDRNEKLEPERARKIMIQVAEGLRAAHRAGIIHRDVKPSNLMLDAEGRVRIADFGLAKPVEAREDVEITQEGAMVGSPLYMAPEQARGRELDHRADMYALGATFYHLLSGRPPFTGTTGLAVVAQHLSDAHEPVQRVAPGVPVKLARIIDRLLEKKPNRRFTSYDELLEALRQAAPDRPAYAGFWTRGAAVTLDSFIAGGLIALLGWPGLVIHLVYMTIVHAYFGQTIGKYFLRIRVHRRDGSRLGILRSAARTVIALWAPVVVGFLILYARGASALETTIERLQPHETEQLQRLLFAIGISNFFLVLLFAAGLVMAAFLPSKRAIHDLAVGSVVTYRLPSN